MPTLADPSRAPEGHHTVKFLSAQPWLGGREGWTDERKARQAGRQLERVRAVAPNLTDDAILASLVKSPVDIEAQNRHMIRGTFHGGDRTLAQSGGLRPAPGWGQYRMPIPGLYQTGGTTHPGGSITGAPGRNAATVLLSDLGLDLEEVVRRCPTPACRQPSITGPRGSRRTASTPTTSGPRRRGSSAGTSGSTRGRETGRGARSRSPRTRATRASGVTAGEAFVRAAVCFHFAKFVWVVDAERNRATTRAGDRRRSTPRTRCSTRPPSASRRRSTAARVVGNLRRPRDVDKAAARGADPGPGLDEGGVLPAGRTSSSRAGWRRCRSTGRARARPASRSTSAPTTRRRSARSSTRSRRARRATSTSSASARRRQPRRLLRAARGRVRAADPGGRRHQRAVRLRRQLGRPAVAHARDDPAPTGASSAGGGARARRGAEPRRACAERIEQPCLVRHRQPRPADPVEPTRSGSRTRRRSGEWVLFDDGNHVCTNIPYKYRPLVADWMRGEARVTAPPGERPAGAAVRPRRYVGQALARREDERVLRGRARYVDDIELADMAHVAFVRSPHASARVGAVRVPPTLPPGVLAVVTPDDLAGRVKRYPKVAIDGMEVSDDQHPVLADGEVRYVGPARRGGRRRVARAGRGLRRGDRGRLRPARGGRRSPRVGRGARALDARRRRRRRRLRPGRARRLRALRDGAGRGGADRGARRGRRPEPRERPAHRVVLGPGHPPPARAARAHPRPPAGVDPRASCPTSAARSGRRATRRRR